MNMKDIHGLGREVIATPGDSVARLVLADALEEYLEESAEGRADRKRDGVAALRGRGDRGTPQGPGWWKCTPLGCIGDRDSVSPYTATGAKRWVLIWVVRDEYVPALINIQGEVTRNPQAPKDYPILTHSELMGCAALATLRPASDGFPGAKRARYSSMVHASTEGQSLIASEETGWDWYCDTCVEELRAKRKREEAKARLEKKHEELKARLNQMGGVDRVSAGEIIMGRVYQPTAPVPNPVSSLGLDDRCYPDYEEEDYDE